MYPIVPWWKWWYVEPGYGFQPGRRGQDLLPFEHGFMIIAASKKKHLRVDPHNQHPQKQLSCHPCFQHFKSYICKSTRLCYPGTCTISSMANITTTQATSVDKPCLNVKQVIWIIWEASTWRYIYIHTYSLEETFPCFFEASHKVQHLEASHKNFNMSIFGFFRYTCRASTSPSPRHHWVPNKSTVKSSSHSMWEPGVFRIENLYIFLFKYKICF